MTIRLATVDDLDEVIRVRRDFNDEWHGHSEAEQAEFEAQLRAYLPGRIESGSLVVVLGEVGTHLASTAFLLVNEYPANCTIPHGRVGVLLNVYTYPAYRRQGLGAVVVAAAVAEGRRLGLDVIDLEATDMGRGLYEGAGFEVREYTPMRLSLT